MPRNGSANHSHAPARVTESMGVDVRCLFCAWMSDVCFVSLRSIAWIRCIDLTFSHYDTIKSDLRFLVVRSSHRWLPGVMSPKAYVSWDKYQALIASTDHKPGKLSIKRLCTLRRTKPTTLAPPISPPQYLSPRFYVLDISFHS